MHFIDYSKYSPEQLLEVRRTINPHVAGENYKNLLEEMERRKVEIEQWQRQQNAASGSNTFTPDQIRTTVKIISYAQAICGIILFSYGLLGSGVVSLIAGLFNIACAALLFKMTYSGFVLSLANSALQTINFTTDSFAYIYRGLAQVSLHQENGWFGIAAEIGPSVSLFIGNTNYNYLSFDVVSFLILLVLFSMLNQREKANNLISGARYHKR